MWKLPVPALQRRHHFMRIAALDSGGAGPGLAPIRTIALGHGGKGSLLNRSSGGLRCAWNCPRKAPVISPA